jgi:hypothetical protein
MTHQQLAFWKSNCSICYYLAVVFMSVCLISVPFCIYIWYGWVTDKELVVAFGKGTATPAIVRHGDTITIRQPIHRYRDCDGEIRRVMTGDCGHYVAWEGPSSVIKGFDGQLVLPVKVPFELIPGQCSFKIYARYYCNPIDRFFERQVYESPAVEFVVKGIDDLK